MQEFNKMIQGEGYNPSDAYLVYLRNNIRQVVAEFNSESDEGRRSEKLQKMLGKVGKNCYITPDIFFDYGVNTEFGDNVYLNANCVILDCAKVKIGSNTMLGPNVQLYTPIHPLEFKLRNQGIEFAKPITIGDNCWIGGSAVILPDVTIGSGAVIGAGAVVTKNVPENTLVAGNPARVIKTIEQI